MSLSKEVLIKQVDNGYIVALNQPLGYKTKVFSTWLELFTEMGSYFARIGDPQPYPRMRDEGEVDYSSKEKTCRGIN